MSEVANRVLKNSGYLYFSMGLSMFVSLYSTRLILNALGSSDFGIFCIIGGAIGMLGFLNAAMSTTTQRFINYAEGEGKLQKQKSIFTVSISIHFLLSLLMVVIFEIAYFFFFNGILNIPSDRIHSAKWIYQLMLLSTVLTIQTVPYNAIINAHENMRYLSIIGVFQTLTKLIIALIVVHIYIDKLILYGILTTFASLIFMIILQIYCHRNYSECTYSIHKYHNKKLMKEMTSFAGWGFINSSSSMFAQYGMGIILNSFFGTILSAAQGVANQISGQLMVFSRTMLMAINPIIGKKAGSNDITNMMRISLFSSKMSFLIIAFFAFPFIIETPYILQLWLKNVPEWSVCFFRFEITRNMLDQLTITLTSAINAEGRIKYYSILRGCSYFLPLPISLFLFHLGFSPYWFYIIWIFTWNGIGSLIILYYAHKNCGMQYADFFKIIIYPILLITISTLSISGIITVYMDESFLRLVIILCTTTIIFIISCWRFVFSSEEKKIILSASMSLLKEIKAKLHPNKNKARNYGLSKAKGQYVSFIDSDDFVASNYLKIIKDIIDSHPDFAIYNYIRWINNAKQEKGRFRLSNRMYHSIHSLYQEAVNLEIVSLSVCCAVFNRNIIETHHIRFNESMKTCEDFMFSLAYYQYIHNFMAINTPVYYYRQNLNSATGKRALQHGLDYQIVFTNISNVFNLQNFPKETTNIFQRRWTRWIIDLISNYKSQNLKSKDIEAAVYSQPYYTAMMHFIPQGILHRIELWLLKKKYSRGIVLYCNIMMHFKHLLKRYKL